MQLISGTRQLYQPRDQTTGKIMWGTICMHKLRDQHVWPVTYKNSLILLSISLDRGTLRLLIGGYFRHGASRSGLKLEVAADQDAQFFPQKSEPCAWTMEGCQCSGFDQSIRTQTDSMTNLGVSRIWFGDRKDANDGFD